MIRSLGAHAHATWKGTDLEALDLERKRGTFVGCWFYFVPDCRRN